MKHLFFAIFWLLLSSQVLAQAGGGYVIESLNVGGNSWDVTASFQGNINLGGTDEVLATDVNTSWVVWAGCTRYQITAAAPIFPFIAHVTIDVPNGIDPPFENAEIGFVNEAYLTTHYGFEPYFLSPVNQSCMEDFYKTKPPTRIENRHVSGGFVTSNNFFEVGQTSVRTFVGLGDDGAAVEQGYGTFSGTFTKVAALHGDTTNYLFDYDKAQILHLSATDSTFYHQEFSRIIQGSAMRLPSVPIITYTVAQPYGLEVHSRYDTDSCQYVFGWDGADLGRQPARYGYNIGALLTDLSLPQKRYVDSLAAAIPGDNWGSQTVSTSAKFSGNGTSGSPLTIATNGVDTINLATGAATGRVIKDGSIFPADLASGAVTTAKIAATAVDSSKLATDAVTFRVIKNGTIGKAEIASNGVDSINLATDAVTFRNIKNGTIGKAEIASNGVDTINLATGAATGRVIKDGSIYAADLATDAVTAVKIAADAVGASEIAAGAVGSSELAQQSATTGQVLKWDGSAWTPGTDNNSGGGGGSPGGSANYIQFNKGSAFAGSYNFVYDSANTRLGLATLAPTSIIGIGGTAARTIGTERHSTSNTAGNNLTLQVGGATIGATDKNGGDLLLKSGVATGSGSSNMRFYTATASTSGTTDRPVTEQMTILGNGNIGLGVTSPSYAIDTKNSGKIRFYMGTGSPYTPHTWSSISIQSDQTYNYNDVQGSARQMIFGCSSNEGGVFIGLGGGPINFYSATAKGATTVYQRFGMPDNGTPAIQYLGGSTSANGTAANISGSLYAVTATATVANTTTETTILGTVAGTKTLPAGLFQTAGRTARITVRGTIATTGTPTLELKLKYGSTVIATTGVVTLGTITGTNEFTAEMLVTCRSTGASGTVQAAGRMKYFSSGTVENPLPMANALTTINTTTSNAIDVTATWGTASASNTISGTLSTVEVIY